MTLKNMTYHRRNCEVLFHHFPLEPVHFPSCVQENHSLSNCKSLIQITQGLKFPVLKKGI